MTTFGTMKRMVLVSALASASLVFAQTGSGTATTPPMGTDSNANHPTDNSAGTSAGTTYNNGQGATGMQAAPGVGGSGDDTTKTEDSMKSETTKTDDMGKTMKKSKKMKKTTKSSTDSTGSTTTTP